MKLSFNVWAKALALVMVLGFSSMVLADDAAPAPADKPLNGKIVSVDTTANTVTVSTGTKANATQVTVTCDANTTVTVDGNAAKLADLVAGEKVVVTPATGTAKTIAAKSVTAKKKGN